MFSQVLSKVNRNKHSQRCTTELICGDNVTNLSLIIQGPRGHPGRPGLPGDRGPRGPRGLAGPPGRDGFSELPTSFFAELKYEDSRLDVNNILHPWTLSDSFNVPTVSDYFAEHTGIFTVPVKGYYQFFLTISMFGTQAIFHIAKNDKHVCTIRIDSEQQQSQNQTIDSSWHSVFIDCLTFCRVKDQITIVVSSTLPISKYSHSVFSGYMLFNN